MCDADRVTGATLVSIQGYADAADSRSHRKFLAAGRLI